MKNSLISFMSADFNEEKASENESPREGETKRSIYIYYAPAIIANTITSARKNYPTEQLDEEMFHEDAWVIGLYHSLIELKKIYTKFSSSDNEPYYIHYAKNEAEQANTLEHLDNRCLM